jgi:uncharacterized membrane protein YgdD (TMEM256/DUF423 family)
MAWAQAVFQCALFTFWGPGARFDMPNISTHAAALADTHPTRQGSLSARLFLSLGALSACASVAFSAAFAHLPVFAGGVPVMVQTALMQQQFHSLGLLFVGLAVWACGPSRGLLAAGGLMLVGLVLFSFNLYARYILGFDVLRALVPWGGGAWILAWLSLALGFATRRAKNGLGQ